MTVMPAGVHMNLSKHTAQYNLKNCRSVGFKVSQLCALLGGSGFQLPFEDETCCLEVVFCVFFSSVIKINLQMVLGAVYQNEK